MVLFPEARAGLVAAILAAGKYNSRKEYAFDGMKGVRLGVSLVVEHPSTRAGLLFFEDPVAEYERIAGKAGPVAVQITADCSFGEDFAAAERLFTVDCFAAMKDRMDAVVAALVRAAVSASYRDEGTEAVAVEAAAQEFFWDQAVLREAETMLGPVDIVRQEDFAEVLA